MFEPEAAHALAEPVIPYLIVANARRALDWYADAMGAHRLGQPLVMADGRIGHSELDFGGGTVYLADESPESHGAAPRPGDDATVSLSFGVADVDGLAARAVRAGARLERAPADYSYGRNAVIRDPFGHRWIISTRSVRSRPAVVSAQPGAMPTRPAPALDPAGPASASGSDPAPVGSRAAVRPSNVVYVSLWVPDGARAAAFYGDVLGWTYRPGSDAGARQVVGQSLPHGVFGGQERSTLFLCFGVEDLSDAIGRVRNAGGDAAEPSVEPYGRTASCVDNQGVRFALVEVPASDPPAVGVPLVESGRKGGENGERQGDVAYLTMEVEDAEKARAFYGSVLSWQFHPGRVVDGWNVVGTAPMTGLHGGQAQATTVPMYRVDDIAAAAARIRARGGTSTDPERQSYGISANCVDDQGTRFDLGQL